MSTVVFLGAGRITSAMIAGLRLGKTRHRLVVHDRNPSKLRDLKKDYKVVVETELARAVGEADLLIIAVRPSSVRELLGALAKEIRSAKKPGAKTMALSLAAGVPIKLLSQLLPDAAWARAMPSPTCRSVRGLTAVTFARSFPRTQRKLVHEIFATFGPVVEIPESKFDAFTVIFSPSHGYHALDALTSAAQTAGLDRKTALLASAHALADSIVAWRMGERTLDYLLEEAATPGGAAAATVSAMSAAGYERAVGEGVAAGLRRAQANAVATRMTGPSSIR